VEQLDQLVGEYVTVFATLEPDSAPFMRALDALARLGERDFVLAAAMSGRLLDRRFRSLNENLASRAPMGRHLAELRKVTAELDPSRIKLGSGGDKDLKALDEYFARFSRIQPRLEAVLAAIAQARFVLVRDNAAIENEQSALAAQMDSLGRYDELTKRLEADLEARAEQLATEDPARAAVLRQRVVPVAKRRRTEIVTQLAIATQGYHSLDAVQANNDQVIDAVGSAVDVASAALRSAALAAQAAAGHRIAIQHSEAARIAAGTMADHAEILEASVSGPDGHVARIRDAWTEIRASLDRVEEQKAAALRAMASADRELTHRGGHR
jgi:uncharacterized protein YaaN involved in tellurite resistance